MSGHFRRRIQSAVQRINQYFVNSTHLQLNDPIDPELDVDTLTTNKSSVERQLQRLKIQVQTVKDESAAWRNFILTKEREEQAREQDNYDGVAVGDNGFEEVIISAEELFADLESRIREYAERIERKMKNENRPQPVHVVMPPQPNINETHIKLPKLEIPKFSGDILQWLSFWEQFQASVDAKPNLSNVQKFAYLKGFLAGEALKLVQGYELSNTNYPVAIEALKEQYAKTSLVKQHHIQRISDLSKATNSLPSLKSTVTEMETHLRSLEALGENLNSLTTLNLIQSKFSYQTLKELTDKRKPEDEWTVPLFRQHLKDYLKAKEELSVISPFIPKETITQSQAEITTKPQPRIQYPSNTTMPQQTQRWRTTAQALPVTTAPIQGFETNRNNKRCSYCRAESHGSQDCSVYPDLASRRAQMIKQKLCENCLNPNHLKRNCGSTRSCFHCQKRHHSTLCPGMTTTMSTTVNEVNQISTSNQSARNQDQGHPCLLSSDERVQMQTAIVKVKNPSQPSKVSTARVFLDSGSVRSYITDRMVKNLELKSKSSTELAVLTFASTSAKRIISPVVELHLLLQDGNSFPIQLNALPHISGTIQKMPINVLLPVSEQELADKFPAEFENFEIDILIGTDYYWDLVGTQRKSTSLTGLYCIESKFGWLLTGKFSTTTDVGKPDKSTNLTLLQFTGKSFPGVPDFNDPLQSKVDLQMFWDLESIGIKEAHQSDDEKALQIFNDTIQFENGRYYVTWPWREPHPDLPDNYALALGRLKSTYQHLIADSELLQKYDQIILDQFTKGIVEIVTPDMNSSDRVHYIPHHPVITPQKTTTKVRIVYDASAKSKVGNLSLNECLFRGPNMLADLVGLLLRFRTNAIGILSDIEKAFLQIGLQECDRDVTRFLWLKDLNEPPVSKNLQIFRFTRVPFGVISSPFLLCATIMFHLNQNNSKIAQDICRNIYMDNLISGVSSEKEAIEYYSTAKQIFLYAGMNLREWTSNSAEFISNVPEIDRTDTTFCKVLGLNWDLKNDNFSVSGPQNLSETRPVTKRLILRTIASIFDPMGLFSPAILNAKVFLQKLWESELDWDSPLDVKTENCWLEIFKVLLDIQTLSVPRVLVLVPIENCVLYCFTDASQYFYSAVIYLPTMSPCGSTKVQLVFSKARLAPIKKKLTIPRLELLAILIGVRSTKFVQSQLRFPISKCILWTDAKYALSWIASRESQGAFVDNRVKEIRSASGIEFRFISGKENPADIATRGASPEDLKQNDKWWHGPTWLEKPQQHWPTFAVSPITPNDLASNDQNTTTHPFFESSCYSDIQSFNQPPSTPFEIDDRRFSSLTRLHRVTGWCLLFVDRLKGKVQKTSFLPSKFQKIGKLLWEKAVQQRGYSDLLKSVKQDTFHPLKQQLKISLDDQGLLRCMGRTKFMNLPFDTRHPILLPRNDHYTRLVIEYCHVEVAHFGVSHTLAHIRENFWVPQGRRQVSKVLSKCMICKKYEGGPYKLPPMPDLPKERVTRSPPFTYIGLDYLGPLYVKKSDIIESQKVWICLFTCLAVRAIHLEIVIDLSAEQFILCLTRFIAKWGKPEAVISDNAPAFGLVRQVVNEEWQNLTHSVSVRKYVSDHGIVWKTITDFAPWMGGFYERLVGLVKRALRKTLGKSRYGLMELQTILTEIQSIINCRPLTYISEELEHGYLSPQNFLSPNQRTGLPPIDLDNDDPNFVLSQNRSAENLRNRWNRVQKSTEKFWENWEADYLLALRERMESLHRQKRVLAKTQPLVGSVVLVKPSEFPTPRGTWRLARIVETLPSADGDIRAAKVKLADSGNVVNRPINLLYPLETEEQTGHLQPQTSQTLETKNDIHTQKSERPGRFAKEQAKKRMQQQLL